MWREDDIEIEHNRIFSKYDGTGNRGIVVILETEARYVDLNCPPPLPRPPQKKDRTQHSLQCALEAVSEGVKGQDLKLATKRLLVPRL